MYEQVQLGTKGIRDAAFVCYYAKDVNPYIGATVDEGFPVGLEDVKCHQILMVMRWDSKLGFPGGMVEEGEELTDAVVRESLEEIGEEADLSELKLISSVCLHDKDLNVHMYMQEMTTQDLYLIQKYSSQEGKHAKIEGMGTLVMTLTDVAKKNLLTAQCAKGVKEHLEAIYEFLG